MIRAHNVAYDWWRRLQYGPILPIITSYWTIQSRLGHKGSPLCISAKGNGSYPFHIQRNFIQTFFSDKQLEGRIKLYVHKFQFELYKASTQGREDNLLHRKKKNILQCGWNLKHIIGVCGYGVQVKNGAIKAQTFPVHTLTKIRTTTHNKNSKEYY